MQSTWHWRARYSVLAVLFTTWIVSFLDRMAISVAMPYISTDFHLSPFQTGLLFSAFFVTYALSHIPGGILADKFGVRRVATAAMLWWSVFSAATGAAANFVTMVAARLVFGIGEGIFPACGFKTIAVWFPKKERATANALMLAANPLGVALSPLIVVWIMSQWGWRAVFYLLFVPGLLVALLFWLLIPDDPSKTARVDSRELAEINSDDANGDPSARAQMGVLEALRQPYVGKYAFIYFCFNITIWGFTAWLPTYLVKFKGFSMQQMGIAASLPFFAGAVGCILGGWVSDRFFKFDRRVPVVLSQLITALSLYVAMISESSTILIISQTVAGFFFTFAVTAIWALPMNTVPRRLMGVVSGSINMAGQLAAIITPVIIGYLIGASSGNFNHVSILLIAAAVVAAAITLTLPRSLISEAN